MTDIVNYLNNLINTYTEYVLSDEDKKVIERDLISFITQKLFLKKFRKQKLFQSTIDDITNKIKSNIEQNKNLYFVIPFGGYKHFWNPSHPEIDWAEVFTLKFLTEWISPVLAVYKAGAVIEFVSEDLVLERMNNYSQESLDKYSKSFKALLEIFNKHLPTNFKFLYTRLGDKFDKNKMLKMVEDKLPKGYERWNSLSEEEKEIELKRSRRSVILKDKNDIDRIIESRIIELTFYDVEADPEFLGNYFDEDNHIGLCFSFGLSADNIYHWLVLGSTYASTVDFWIGRGILETRENRMVERIVSKEQYFKIKEMLKKTEINLKEISINNLKTIELITEEDWNKIYD